MRSQLDIMQNIMIMILLIIIFIGAFLMYVWYVGVKTQTDTMKFQQSEQTEKVTLLGQLPELQCTRNSVVVEQCIDMEKMRHFDVMQADLADTLGFMTLSVRRLKEDGSWQHYALYERTREADSRRTIEQPVTLYDPIADTAYYGVLEAEVYT